MVYEDWVARGASGVDPSDIIVKRIVKSQENVVIEFTNGDY